MKCFQANSRFLRAIQSAIRFAAILKSEPAPLGGNIPAELQHIVKKCLQKDAGERYKEAKDLLVDLRQIARQLEIGSEIELANSTGENEAKTQIIDAPTTAAPALSSAEYLTGEIKQHKRGFLAVLSRIRTRLHP